MNIKDLKKATSCSLHNSTPILSKPEKIKKPYIHSANHMSQYVIKGRIYDVWVTYDISRNSKYYITINDYKLGIKLYERSAVNAKQVRGIIKNYFMNITGYLTSEIPVNF
jgi:hypothetical protein